MAEEDTAVPTAKPVPNLEKCCGCIQLKLGVQIIAICQVIQVVLTWAFALWFLFFGAALLKDPDVQNEIPEEARGTVNWAVESGWVFVGICLVALWLSIEGVLAIWSLIQLGSESGVTSLRYWFWWRIILVSLGFLGFLIGGKYSIADIIGELFDLVISLYFSWCIWSLAQAFEEGGEKATNAGFSNTAGAEKAPLLDGGTGTSKSVA